MVIRAFSSGIGVVVATLIVALLVLYLKRKKRIRSKRNKSKIPNIIPMSAKPVSLT